MATHEAAGMSDERRHAMRAARIRWEQAIAPEVQAEREAKQLRAHSIRQAIRIGTQATKNDPFRRAG